MMGLTSGQAKVLAVIKRWFAAQGRAPTVREIMAEAELLSTSQVSWAMRGLVERGYVRRTAGYARTIQLVEPAPRYVLVPIYTLHQVAAQAIAARVMAA